ncbi:hypothetical protein M3Y97_00931900 [Aphelenchoides bicaudatus]|nr:hypothetical protein M3Y97_00931900 [Aphelenchoides bicaudatus]
MSHVGSGGGNAAALASATRSVMSSTSTTSTRSTSSKSSSSTHLKDGIIDLAAGTLGGVANVYAGQPLDTVKVKMQTFPKLYSNWIGCLRDTFKLDGVRGLYAGTVPALVANVAAVHSENAVLFTAYGYCQKTVAYLSNGTDDVSKMTSLQNAFSGSLAAIFAALVLCPTELVKCRLQAQREINPNIKNTPITVCRQMLKTEGVSAFTTGMIPTLAREVPGYFCFFGAYEMCRYLLTPKGQSKDEIGLMKTALAGSAGGVALWTAIFPADVVKSRMQIQGGTAKQVTMDVLKNEGVSGLYKGLTPTLLRTCVASACLFIAYENTKKILHSRL